MTETQIQFLDEIPIDERHTLHQLLGRFQTVRDGLPELVKNAKDQYARRGVVERAARPIVVLADGSRGQLAVLDFAGATPQDFEHWLVWSDPHASRVGAAPDIEGRHGNGGKGFMVRGSTRVAFLESVVDGRRTKMGFRNDLDEVQYYPGTFVEGGELVRDLPIGDPLGALETALDRLGLAFADLPEAARRAFAERRAYTLAQVEGVRDWARRPAEALAALVERVEDDLIVHPQAALSIDTCTVYVWRAGGALAGPLERQLPKPLDGFERGWRIKVPDPLPDPESGAEVATGPGTKREKYLHLQTSSRSLRMPGKRPLNVIRIRNARNVVANWSVAALYPHAESAFVFGELRLPALELDHIAGADRTTLADTALVRALQHWVTDRLQELCGAIQQAMAEDYDASDRRKVNRELRQFRRIMSNFLESTARRPRSGDQERPTATLLVAEDSGPEAVEDPEQPGDTGSDRAEQAATNVHDALREHGEAGADEAEATAALEDESAAARRRRKRARRRRRKYVITEIDLEPGRDHLALALGTRIPLVAEVMEVNGEGQRRRARRPKLELDPGAGGVVAFETEGVVLRALATGETTIALRDPRSGVASRPVTVEVVAARDARYEDVPRRLLRQGERTTLAVAFDTVAGERRDLLLEAWLDEPDMGRIDRYGVFTAGRHAGEVTVRVRYGAREGDTTAVELEIGEEIERGRPVRRAEGSHLPHILVCGTPAPGMDHFPPNQRTVQGGPHEPTIIDFEPQFEHVIFINPSSEESIRMREGRGGRRGVAGISTKPYLRFLAIKCFEILKRLYVRQRVADRLLSEAEFRRLFAQAEIACAPFVDSAYSVAESLARST